MEMPLEQLREAIQETIAELKRTSFEFHNKATRNKEFDPGTVHKAIHLLGLADIELMYVSGEGC